jgi:hypothetical protein
MFLAATPQQEQPAAHRLAAHTVAVSMQPTLAAALAMAAAMDGPVQHHRRLAATPPQRAARHNSLLLPYLAYLPQHPMDIQHAMPWQLHRQQPRLW